MGLQQPLSKAFPDVVDLTRDPAATLDRGPVVMSDRQMATFFWDSHCSRTALSVSGSLPQSGHASLPVDRNVDVLPVLHSPLASEHNPRSAWNGVRLRPAVGFCPPGRHSVPMLPGSCIMIR